MSWGVRRELSDDLFSLPLLKAGVRDVERGTTRFKLFFFIGNYGFRLSDKFFLNRNLTRNFK